MDLNRFKSFDADRMDLDDLIALSAFGSQLRAEYEKHNVEEPEFVASQIKALRRAINARNAASLEARKKEITARLESLKTPAERKAALLKEKQKLENQLAEVGV